jgi:cobalt-zinc-cadmium efflux system outer membrane protein
MRHFLLAACLFAGISWSLHAQTILSLSDAVRLAKGHNTVLKAEKLNIELARADLITARLRPNPTLNNQTLQQMNPSFFPNDTRWSNAKNRQVWWQLTKQFQWPSIRQGKIDVAAQSIFLAENDYYDIERNLSFDVAAQYLEVWRLKQVLSNLQQAQLNFDSLVSIQEARYKSQVITSTELLRTRIPLEQYRLQLRSTRQDYINNIQQLKFLLGSPDSVDVVDGPLTEPIAITGTEDSLVARVLKERPDVKATLSEMAVSESNLKLQRAQRMPIPELGFIWNPQNTVPYLGFFGTIQIPIFSRNQGNIAASYVQRDQATLHLQTIQLQVNTEINAAWQTYHLQRETIGRYDQILQQSRDVLRSVRYSYFRGGTTLIDLLEAQRSWYDTQKLYHEAQFQYYQSYLKLLLAAGVITQL